MAASIASIVSFVYNQLSSSSSDMASNPEQSTSLDQPKPKLTAVWRTKSTPQDLNNPPTSPRFKEDGSLLRLLRTKSMPALAMEKGSPLRRGQTLTTDIDSNSRSSSLQHMSSRYSSLRLSEVGSDSISTTTPPPTPRSPSPSGQRKLTRSVSEGYLWAKRRRSRKDVKDEFPTGTLPSVKNLKYKFDRKSEGELQEALGYQKPTTPMFEKYDSTDGSVQLHEGLPATNSEKKLKTKKEVDRRRASRHQSLLEWEEVSSEFSSNSHYDIQPSSVKKLRKKFENSSASEADDAVFHTSTPKRPMSKSTDGLENSGVSAMTPPTHEEKEDSQHKEEKKERKSRSLTKRDSKIARLRARSEPDPASIRQLRSQKMPVSVKELMMKFEIQASPDTLPPKTSVPERASYVIKNGTTTAVTPDQSSMVRSVSKTTTLAEKVPTREASTTITQTGGITVSEIVITEKAVTPKIKSTTEEVAVMQVGKAKKTEAAKKTEITMKSEITQKSELAKKTETAIKSEITKLNEPVLKIKTAVKSDTTKASSHIASSFEHKKSSKKQQTSHQSLEDSSFTYRTPSVRSLKKRFEQATSTQSYVETAGGDDATRPSQTVKPGLSVTPSDIKPSSGEQESRKRDWGFLAVQESHRHSLTSSSIRNLMRQFESCTPEESTVQGDTKFSFEQEVTTKDTKSKVLKRQRRVSKPETESDEISRSLLTTSTASTGSIVHKTERDNSSSSSDDEDEKKEPRRRQRRRGSSESSSDGENLAKKEMKEERLARERWEREEQERKRKENEEWELKERARLEQERRERERAEQQRKENERIDRERKEKEALEKIIFEKMERERREKEKKAIEMAEKERKEKERKERERAERERVERERQEREKAELERRIREKMEKERKEKERAEKEMLEREKAEKERKEKERLERERAERERAEREKKEKDRLERLKAEKEAMLIVEREKRQRRVSKSSESESSSDSESEEKERLAKEAAERELERERKALERKRREREEHLKREREEYERRKREREEAERREREKEEAERKKREKEEKERREREEQERKKREKEEEERKKEKEEAERKEREREEQERKRREKEEKERLERENAERERKERERIERERKEKEEKEKLEREKAERERKEKEMAEQERKAKEKAENERREREKAEQERKEKERKEREEQKRIEKERKEREAEEQEQKEREKKEKEKAEQEKRERERREKAEQERKERKRAERNRKSSDSDTSEDEEREAKVNVHSLVGRFAKIQEDTVTGTDNSSSSSKIRSDSVRSDDVEADGNVGKLINKFTNLRDADLELDAEEKLDQGVTEDRRLSDVAALVGKFAHLLDRRPSGSSHSGDSDHETKAKVTPAIPKISTKAALGNTRTLREDEMKFFTSGNSGESFIRSQSLRVKKTEPPPFTQPRFGSMRETKSKTRTDSSSDSESHESKSREAAPTPETSTKGTPGNTRTLREDELKFFTSGNAGENFMRTQSLRVKKSEQSFSQPRFGSLREKKTRAQELAESEMGERKTPKNLPKNCRMLRPDELEFFKGRNFNVYQSSKKTSKHKKKVANGTSNRDQVFRLGSQSDQDPRHSGDDHRHSLTSDSDDSILRGSDSEEEEYSEEEIHTEDLEVTLMIHDYQNFSGNEDSLDLDSQSTPTQIIKESSGLDPVDLEESGDKQFLVMVSQDNPRGGDDDEHQLRTEFRGKDNLQASEAKQTLEIWETDCLESVKENVVMKMEEVQTDRKKNQVQQFLEIWEQKNTGSGEDIHESRTEFREENEHKTQSRENGTVIDLQVTRGASADQSSVKESWVLESYDKKSATDVNKASEVKGSFISESKTEENSYTVHSSIETRSLEVLETYTKNQTHQETTENESDFEIIGATQKTVPQATTVATIITGAQTMKEKTTVGESRQTLESFLEAQREAIQRREEYQRQDTLPIEEAACGQYYEVPHTITHEEENEKNKERSKEGKESKEKKSEKRKEVNQEHEEKKDAQTEKAGDEKDESKDYKQEEGENEENKDGRLSKTESEGEDSDTVIGLLDAALISIDRQESEERVMKREKAEQWKVEGKTEELMKKGESEKWKVSRGKEEEETLKREESKQREVEEKTMMRQESEEWKVGRQEMEEALKEAAQTSMDLSSESEEESPKRIGGKEKMKQNELMVQNYMTMMHDLEFIAELSQLNRELMEGTTNKEEATVSKEEATVNKEEATVNKKQSTVRTGKHISFSDPLVMEKEVKEREIVKEEVTGAAGIKQSESMFESRVTKDEITVAGGGMKMIDEFERQIIQGEIMTEKEKSRNKSEIRGHVTKALTEEYATDIYKGNVAQKDEEMDGEMIKEDFILICVLLGGLSVFLYYFFIFLYPLTP